MRERIADVEIWRLFVEDQKHRTKIDIKNLAHSLQTTGQINPIVVKKVGDEFKVIAGRRRYAAFKYIQEELTPNVTVKAKVYITEVNELQEELIKIDENIMRQQLTGAEFDEAIYRRKQIYEEINPETKQHTSGGVGKHAKEPDKKKAAFTKDAAGKLQVSRRTIEKAVARAAKAADVVKRARESGAIPPSKVDLLIMLSPKDQEIMLPIVKNRDLNETKLLIEQAKKRGAKTVKIILEETIEEHSELKKLTKQVDELSDILKKYVSDGIVFKGEQRWQDIKAFDHLAKQLERFINFQKSKMGHVKAILRRGDDRREILEAFRG